jgi:hypothetical protein
MLIRRHFTAPPGTTSLHLDGTVDNNADVYLNGTLLGHVGSGNCATVATSSFPVTSAIWPTPAAQSPCSTPDKNQAV